MDTSTNTIYAVRINEPYVGNSFYRFLPKTIMRGMVPASDPLVCVMARNSEWTEDVHAWYHRTRLCGCPLAL